jgi:hypothetical protein
MFNTMATVLWGQQSIQEFVSPDLNTVRLHREGWNLAHPIIQLKGNEQLQLSFDEPGGSVKNYHYSVTLCDANWVESILMPTEYYTGILVNPILDYSYSFNTTFDYVHYNLVFPESENRIMMSGNYVIKVFEDYNEKVPVLIKKFMVVETVASIRAHIRHTAQSSIRESHQEIQFEVEHKSFDIRNPVNEVTATIIQNGRIDNMITGLRPQFYGNGTMDFNYMRETLMEGGNEFRYVDLRSGRFVVDNVREMQYVEPFYHAKLSTDHSRKTEPYRFRRDLNGRYHIEVREYENYDTEADYFFVHFRLYSNFAEPSEKVYLNGELTNWMQTPFSEMSYNPLEKCYQLTLLLKQGYYNYQYLTVKDGETKGSLYNFEGNFEQTENDYLILIYYKGVSDRCHRLIGAETFNSVGQ